MCVCVCVCRASEAKDNISFSSNEDSSSAHPVATHMQKANLSAALRRSSSPTTGGQAGSGRTGPLTAALNMGDTGSVPKTQHSTSAGVLPEGSRSLKVADLGLDISAGFDSTEEEEDDSVELQVVAQLAAKPPLLPTTLPSPPPHSSSLAPQHPTMGKDGSGGGGSVMKELDLPSDSDGAVLKNVAPSFSPIQGGATASPTHATGGVAKDSSGIGGQALSLKPKLDIGEDFDSDTDFDAEPPKPHYQLSLHGQSKIEPGSSPQRPPKEEQGEEWSDLSGGEDDEGLLAASGRKASKYFEHDSGSSGDELPAQKRGAKSLVEEMFGLPSAQLQQGGEEEEEEESDFDSDIDLPEGGESGYVPSAFGGDSQRKSSTASVGGGGGRQTPSSGGKLKSFSPAMASLPSQLGGPDTPSSTSLLSPTSPARTVTVTPLPAAANSTPFTLDHAEGGTRSVLSAAQPNPPGVKGELDFSLEEVGASPPTRPGGVVNVEGGSEVAEEEKEVEEEEESDWDSGKEEEEDEGGECVRGSAVSVGQTFNHT